MAVSESTKLLVKRRVNSRCEDCLQQLPLECHHLNYRSDEVDNLVATCRTCHRRRHILLCGEFSRDPEEVVWEREAYYEALTKDD